MIQLLCGVHRQRADQASRLSPGKRTFAALTDPQQARWAYRRSGRGVSAQFRKVGCAGSDTKQFT